MTFGEATSQVKAEGGFSNDARVAAWINSRYRSAVARARWLMAEVELGPTVANEGRYAVASNIVDLERISVAGVNATRIGPGDMWSVKNAAGRVRGLVFAPGADTNGGLHVELWPVPSTAGESVTALAALEPPSLSDATDTPLIPTDLHDAILVDGAIAQGLRRIDERIADADSFEARYENAVQELTRRRNGRIGAGPVQAQIAGYHF